MTDLRPEPRRARRVERNHLPEPTPWGQGGQPPTGRHAQQPVRHPQPARVHQSGVPGRGLPRSFPGRPAPDQPTATVAPYAPQADPNRRGNRAARSGTGRGLDIAHREPTRDTGREPSGATNRLPADLAALRDRTTTITPVVRPDAEPERDADHQSAPDADGPRQARPRRAQPAGGVPLAAHPWHLTLLAGLAFALHIALARTGGYSWHFFADGASLLFGHHPPGMILPGGLHLYANYPQLQFGPVALLVAAAVRPFGADGWMVVSGLMTMSGLFVLHMLDNVVYAVRPDLRSAPRSLRLTMLIGGGSFLFSWELLAVHFGHLDDVLALVFITGALAAAVSRRPLLAGLCVGLAADSKPWALVCVALLLMCSRSGRVLAVGVAVLAIVVAWLPFVLADPHTLSATQFTIPNVPASALHALGVNDPTTPSWDRMAQLVLGCGLGLLAVIRRRWAAVIALGIGARLLLDPSVYTYYTAGFALGLLLWDLAGWRRPMPLLSLLSFCSITMVVFLVHDAHVLGELRLWTVLVCAAIMLIAPSGQGRMRRPQAEDEAPPGPETGEYHPVLARGRAA